MAWDRRTPKFVRAILLLAALYVASPIDLIPDWLPGVGWLDDMGILSMLVTVAWWFIPKESKRALPAR